MIKYLLFLILPIIISACGGFQVRELSIVGFEKYVAQFEKDAYNHGKLIIIDDLVIQFGDLKKLYPDKDWVGVCQRYYYNTANTITIDKAYWDKTSEEGREWLIYHEISHCALNRNHRDDFLPETKCVASIMYHKVRHECYYNLKDYYLKELFTIP